MEEIFVYFLVPFLINLINEELRVAQNQVVYHFPIGGWHWPPGPLCGQRTCGYPHCRPWCISPLLPTIRFPALCRDGRPASWRGWATSMQGHEFIPQSEPRQELLGNAKGFYWQKGIFLHGRPWYLWVCGSKETSLEETTGSGWPASSAAPHALNASRQAASQQASASHCVT
jgi:hypothetical protein